jgi:glutaryl-CoA dehydrogenase
VRTFLESEIKPIVNRYWLKGEFPHEIIPRLASLNICGVTYEGYGCPHLPFLMEGILAMEMANWNGCPGCNPSALSAPLG